MSSCTDCLEGNAGGKHPLDERGRGHQTLQLQVEDALERLDAERTQLRQLVQHPAQVLRLPLRFGVVGGVVTQTVHQSCLQLFHLLGFGQSVPLWKVKVDVNFRTFAGKSNRRLL